MSLHVYVLSNILVTFIFRWYRHFLILNSIGLSLVTLHNIWIQNPLYKELFCVFNCLTLSTPILNSFQDGESTNVLFQHSNWVRGSFNEHLFEILIGNPNIALFKD